ncbi:MAG: HAD hydrolase-like protein [Rhodospirillales bacterium]|jgi:phosphoglycolate phosphatase-like HAD superfamily hydrolase|nr:HAD hydrolase-like protein [Rhodospirillales bacterium]
MTRRPDAGATKTGRSELIFPDAIFFDFDGVLVESNAIKVDAFERLYAGYGPAILARVMDYIDGNEGISRVEKIRHAHEAFLGVRLGDAELSVLAERYSQMVEAAVATCPWVSGAREFLETYAGRLPLFVVTGTPEVEIRRIADRRGLTPYFREIRGSPPRKPPIVRELLDRHRLAAERAVFIGDAPFDRQTALETGLRFIGRVPAGRPSPFPTATETAPDLRDLAERLAAPVDITIA